MERLLAELAGKSSSGTSDEPLSEFTLLELFLTVLVP
jgi:hypothetical protein